MPKTLPLILALLLLLSPLRAFSQTTQPSPTQPAQPTSGPGGLDYPHKSLTSFSYNHGDTQFWMFEPADPVPESAPVIVFMHGWAAMDPNLYGAWIKHLVRHGSIVIFPRYQSALVTPGADFVPNAATAISSALAELQKPGHVKPDLEHFYMVSHSMGGPIIASLAATAEERKLPKPRAIMLVEPGGSQVAQLPDLSKVPPQTLIIVVAGIDDQIVKSEPSFLFRKFTSVPTDHKLFITLLPDDHGQPPILAGHMVPLCMDHDLDADHILDHDSLKPLSTSPRRTRLRVLESAIMITDASDYGLWKTFDMLRDLSNRNLDLSPAHTNTKEFRSMGLWSDGTPVKPIATTHEP